MARARNVKPSLFKNEILGGGDPFYSLLFIGLWTLADRAGRLEDRPLRIKAEIFPYRDGINVDEMLSWLQQGGFILRYEIAGQKYIQIINFEKHQNPHVKETASTVPAPGLSSAEPVITGTGPADSLLLIPDSLNPSSAGAEHCAFDDAWAMYPKRSGANPKRDALKCWNARLKAKVGEDVMLQGVRRYRAYCEARQIIGTEFVMQAKRFFGPSEPFAEGWEPPKEPGGKGKKTYADYRK